MTEPTMSLNRILVCCILSAMTAQGALAAGWEAADGTFNLAEGIRPIPASEVAQFAQAFARAAELRGEIQRAGSGDSAARVAALGQLSDVYNEIGKKWGNSPEGMDCILQRAIVQTELRQFDESIAGLDRIIRTHAGNQYEAEARLMLASVYEKMKERGKAADELETIIAKYPKSCVAYRACIERTNLCVGPSGGYDFAGAIPWLEKVGPEDPALFFNAQMQIARALIQSGQEDKGLAKYEWMRSVFPKDSPEKYHAQIGIAEEAAKNSIEKRKARAPKGLQ